ncbi:glycosyltransferase [Actinoplanes sp. NPDC024001]|uniref:glycosyltransferase n=1 Tax=Actinoplanes sp. NPDC024001 TaxID=3154598 RepID=UPI0033E17CB8
MTRRSPCVLFHSAIGATLNLFVAPVSAALAEHGVRRIAVVGRDSVPPGMAACFDEIHEVTAFRRGSLRAIARAGAELHRVVRSTRPDLMHLHTPYAVALGRVVARLTGTPHIAVIHGTFFEEPGRAARLFSLVEGATAWLTRTYVTVNGQDRDSYRRLAPRSRVKLAPCGGAGIDIDRLRADAASRAAMPGRPPRVLALGRLTPDKNLDLAVAAWRAARAQVPGLELRIVGSTMPGELPWHPPDEHGITTGSWTDAPGRELAQADVLLSTSRREGFGMTLAEALVLGTRVVAVANRGSRAVAEQAGVGISLTPGQPDEVAAALVERLRAPSTTMLSSISEAWARQTVVDFHTAHILEELGHPAGVGTAHA